MNRRIAMISEHASPLATLGGVVAETPSPLDANADATVGDLADGPTLALVGLAGRAAARCYELSSVERWRLALARAVAMRRVPVIVDCSRGTPAPRPGLGTLLLGLRDAGATRLSSLPQLASEWAAARLVPA